MNSLFLIKIKSKYISPLCLSISQNILRIKNNSKHKRMHLFAGLFMIVSCIIAASILMTRTHTALPSASQADSQEVAHSIVAVDVPSRLEDLSVLDILNSEVYTPSLSMLVEGSMATYEYTKFTNGKAIAEYCNTPNCAATSTKNKLELSIQKVSSRDGQISSNKSAYDDVAALIMTAKYPNAKVKSYLIVFNLNYSLKGSTTRVSLASAVNISDGATDVKSLTILEGAAVHVDIEEIKEGRTISRAFVIDSSKRFNSLVELSKDQKLKTYKDEAFGTSFSYPVKASINMAFSERNEALEEKLAKSPIYFSSPCGLEPAMSDKDYHLSYVDETGESAINVTLSIHKIKSDTVYMTSSRYGYDPLDWDKIIESISIKEYSDAIYSGEQIQGRNVSVDKNSENIIRHIESFSEGRPCNDFGREQYQWLSQNALMNLVIEKPTSKGSFAHDLSDDEMVNVIIKTLKVND